MPVGKDLNFDVARRGDIFLDQHAARTERRRGLADRAFKRIIEIGLRVDPAHAAAAAARRRLYQDRIADCVRLLPEEFRVLPLAVIARHNRDAGFLHQRLGAIFKAHRPHRRRRRSHEYDTGLRARVGEITAFGQESVARVDAFRARQLCDFDQPIDREIAFTRLGRTDEIGLVAEPPMQRVGVRRRIDRDRAHAEPFGGARDAAGDFAAVGNKDGAEHHRGLAASASFLQLTHCARTGPPALALGEGGLS